MPQKTINGTTIDVNEEGFMTDHSQWNREVAAGLVKQLDGAGQPLSRTQ